MRRIKQSSDLILFLTVLILLSIGIVMVFSASCYYAMFPPFNNPYYFFTRQLIYAGLGLFTLFFFWRYYNYQHLKKWSGCLLITALILLTAVLIPGLGVEKLGAQRWLRMGSLSFQPSELAKLCLVIFTAYGLSRYPEKVFNFWRGILPYLLILGLAAGLIMKQPDLGTTVTLAGTIFIMLFVAGARIKHLAALATLGIGAVALAIWQEPYRLKRFLAFLNPEKDPAGSGWHILNSLLSLGSGGLLGTGLGQGRHSKFLYLPIREADFIFAVIGEELGFIGACLVIFLFLIFFWRGFRIAITSPDPFGSLLAAGIVGGIALQTIINIGVVTSTFPITGITLPFISFGGTSLVFTLAGVGILLNISRQTRRV